jgi:hypothetical protein
VLLWGAFCRLYTHTVKHATFFYMICFHVFKCIWKIHGGYPMIRSGFDAEIVGNFCLSFQTAELIRFPLSRP